MDIFTGMLFTMVLCFLMACVWEGAEYLYFKYIPEHVRDQISKVWKMFTHRATGTPSEVKEEVAEEAATA